MTEHKYEEYIPFNVWLDMVGGVDTGLAIDGINVVISIPQRKAFYVDLNRYKGNTICKVVIIDIKDVTNSDIEFIEHENYYSVPLATETKSGVLISTTFTIKKNAIGA